MTGIPAVSFKDQTV